MEGVIEKEAMFKLTYGLFVLTVNDGMKDNGCIVNTVSMLTETPKRITVYVNKLNYTEQMIRKQGMLYFVGRSFVTLYDEDVNNFIVCDIFSVKFVYFYMPGDRPRYNYNLLPPVSGEPGMGMRQR